MLLLEAVSKQNETPFCELLVSKAPKAPKTRQVLAFLPGFPPELDDKVLLLKTPHTLGVKLFYMLF